MRPPLDAPRRVSGPLPGGSRVLELGSRGLGLRTLPDHPLLDRLVRGRFWIPLLGALLAGIVAMQVEVLKLNASIGRSLQQSAALQSRNELLRASVTSLADGQRIEAIAARMGMVMPAPDAVGFLSAQSGAAGVARAAASIHAPNPAGFLSLLSSNGAVVTGNEAPSSGASGTSSAPAGGASASSAAGTSSAPAPAAPGAFPSARAATAPASVSGG